MTPNKKLFYKLLKNSLIKRKAAVILIVLAITAGISLLSALLNIWLNSNEQTAKELRSFGANLIILPKSINDQAGIGSIKINSKTRPFIDDKDINIALKSVKRQLVASNSVLYDTAVYIKKNKSNSFTVAGINPEDLKKTNSWWQINGRWLSPRAEDKKINEAMVGTDIAEDLGLKKNGIFAMSISGKEVKTKAVSIVKTGSSEDKYIFMRLDKLQALNGMKNKVSMVQVSVKTDQFSVEKLGKSMEKISGNIEAKPVSQIVSAENSIQRKIQLLLAIISAIVLFTASMAVISAQVGMIIERGSEIGLMKALGASDRDVNNLFLSEVFIMGFVSGVFGFFIGAIISVVLSAAVFKSLPDIKLVVLPAAVAASVLVSLIASTFALKKMTELNPVTILRGE